MKRKQSTSRKQNVVKNIQIIENRDEFEMFKYLPIYEESLSNRNPAMATITSEKAKLRQIKSLLKKSKCSDLTEEIYFSFIRDRIPKKEIKEWQQHLNFLFPSADHKTNIELFNASEINYLIIAKGKKVYKFNNKLTLSLYKRILQEYINSFNPSYHVHPWEHKIYIPENSLEASLFYSIIPSNPKHKLSIRKKCIMIYELLKIFSLHPIPTKSPETIDEEYKYNIIYKRIKKIIIEHNFYFKKSQK